MAKRRKTFKRKPAKRTSKRRTTSRRSGGAKVMRLVIDTGPAQRAYPSLTPKRKVF